MDNKDIKFNTEINPWAYKSTKSNGANGANNASVDEFNEFAKTVESKKLLNFSTNFDLYSKEIMATGKKFSFHAVSIPGFVGSLNDSFMLYGLGDKFLSEIANKIETHFAEQGKICKVLSEGVNLVIMLEGETPEDMAKQLKDVIKNNEFKFPISLHDIPDTPEGNKIKAKVTKWARQHQEPIEPKTLKVNVDLKTFEMTSGITHRAGIPAPKVGSFDLPPEAALTQLQLKRMTFKLIDWTKFDGGTGKLTFEDPRLVGMKSEDLVVLRETDLSKVDMRRVLKDFQVNKRIFDVASNCAPSEFNEEVNRTSLSKDTREFLKSINDSLFLDFTYQVMNEKAFEARIDSLSAKQEVYYAFSGDITNLGGINREYGKIVGDVYLKAYFETWNGVSAKYAKEGISVEVARCGADEFGLIIKGTDSDAKVLEINKEFLNRIKSMTIDVKTAFIGKEELAKLKNKGIEPQDGRVFFKVGDIFRTYAKGSRFDIGTSHTMYGEKILRGSKRKGESVNARLKTHAKEQKKRYAADGKTFITLKGTDGADDLRIKQEYKADYSSAKTAKRAASQYYANGAPGGDMVQKGAAFGYNAAASSGAFFGADVLFSLGEAGYNTMIGDSNVGGKFVNEIKGSAMSNLEFGALDATFRTVWNSNKLASPGALFIMTANNIASAAPENKGYATLSGGVGLGAFMGTQSYATSALAEAFGYSTKTPGPFWIKATSFGLAYLSTKVAGAGMEAIYENNPTARKIIESAPIQATGNVLSAVSEPLNVAFAMGTASKAFAMMTPGAAAGVAPTGATAVGVSAAALIGWTSIGTYAVVGGAEHIMLDGHTIEVAKEAKQMWKQDMGGFGKAMFTVADFLAAPVMDAVTPEVYRDTVYSGQEHAEKAVKETLGNILFKTAVLNDNFDPSNKGSAIPFLSQYGAGFKEQFKAQIEEWLKTEGAMPAFKTALRAMGSNPDDKASMAISKIRVNSNGSVDISDEAVQAMFSRMTVNGKPLALSIIQERRK
jgi:GGDEF domain-containing protein